MSRALRLVLLCAFASGVMLAAETPAPPGGATSSYMRAVLASKLPRFDPALAAKPQPAPELNPAQVDAPADPDVVQMPKVVINENKMPTPEEMLTDAAKAELAMNRYLGSPDGLDRGFLNRFTIAQFWHKVPILGKIAPGLFGVTNEERAMSLYRRDQRLRQKQGMLDLGSLLKTSDPALGEMIKRDTRRLMGPQ